MSATDELKPCPFCGGKAKVNTLKWNSGYTATALCKNKPNAHYINTWDEDEERAVERITEAWNTRAEWTCKCTTDDSAWCFVCSECGKSFPRNKLHLAHNHGEINYCPNCGRKVVE